MGQHITFSASTFNSYFPDPLVFTLALRLTVDLRSLGSGFRFSYISRSATEIQPRSNLTFTVAPVFVFSSPSQDNVSSGKYTVLRICQYDKGYCILQNIHNDPHLVGRF